MSPYGGFADTRHDDSTTLATTRVVPHECPFCEAGQRLPPVNERYGVSLVSSGGVVLHRTSGGVFLKYDNSEGRMSPGYAAIDYCPKCGRKLT